MSDKKTGNKTKFDHSQNISDRQHPFKTYLFFALVGSSILFLSMVFMFIVWVNQNYITSGFQVPKVFIVSTVVMLFSSYAVTKIKKAFENDNTKQLLISLSSTLILGTIFCALQCAGWKSMYDHGFFIDGEAGISFLYIISGLHLAHVLGGMIYLFFLNIKAFDNWNDPVHALVYFSNKFEGVRLEVFSTYWHFIDALWVILFFTFLFSF
jgi:cytochrome c oxidase subunit 3